MPYTPWEFDNLRQMLFHLVGRDFGDEPEKRIDEIREFKKAEARGIVAIAKLRKSDTVLNLGSGCGFISRHIAPKVKRLYCCDISASYLEFAKKECARIENITFHKIDSAHFDFLQSASIDTVIACSVFIHLNLFDTFWYFQEFHRVVKSNGRVWLNIADAEQLNIKTDRNFLRMMQYYRKQPEALPALMQWNSPKVVVKIANNFGFKVASHQYSRQFGTSDFLFVKG